MQIADRTVATFHYTLKSPEGSLIETSHDGGVPVTYLHGTGGIILGLGRALEGKQAGDRVEVTIDPIDAYGPRRENLCKRIPAKHLGGTGRLRPGMQVPLRLEQGTRLVTVLKVGKFSVDVDANHPLAGQTLCFDVEIQSVREATPEEIAHGHAHGPDGHAHHD